MTNLFSPSAQSRKLIEFPFLEQDKMFVLCVFISKKQGNQNSLDCYHVGNDVTILTPPTHCQNA